MESWWAERVTELLRSGDAGAVARKYGVREKTLVWWRSELRRRGRPVAEARLLPVVVARASRPLGTVAASDEVEVFVEVGVARMTLRGAVSAEHIAAIVSASARTC